MVIKNAASIADTSTQTDQTDAEMEHAARASAEARMADMESGLRRLRGE